VTSGHAEANVDPDENLIRRLGWFSWSSLGVLALVGVVIYLIIQGRIILAPLFLSMVIVFILNPLVSRLERMHIHRVIGTTVGFGVIIAMLVLAAALVIPSIVEQGETFAADFPELYDEFTAQTISLAERFGVEVSFWDYDRIVEYINDPENQDTIVSLVLDRVGSVTSGIFEFILVFLLGPVLAFYFLIDLPNMRDRLMGFVPEDDRAEVANVGGQLNTAVGGFLRGQLLVAIFVGVMLAFGYWLIDLPFWLLIGLVGGALNLVPFLGPWVGGALGVIVALATTDVSTAIWAAVVAFGVQQIDNNFVSPMVLRATVRLHPAITLTILVLAGAIGGFWGIIIAVPLAASVKVVGGHWYRTRVLGQTWEEAEEAIIADAPQPAVRRFRTTREMEAIHLDRGPEEDDTADGDSGEDG
jgi:predicted PurR-regulated permease PerM